MPKDLLTELADVEVPPPPQDFGAQVHQKLNHWLLIGHLADLAVRGTPYAIGHFARAAIGLVTYSLSGRYATEGEGSSGNSAEDGPGVS